MVATGILFSIMFHVGTKEPKGYFAAKKADTGKISRLLLSLFVDCSRYNLAMFLSLY